MQNVLHPVKGDCLRACVASLLNMDRNDVPNFCGLFPDDNEKFGWFELFYYWMWHMGYLVEKHDDIRDIEAVKKAMKGVDYVLHQAALRSVPKSVDNPVLTSDINVNGTLNVFIAAKEAGVKKVVYASSSSVYGDCSPPVP